METTEQKVSRLEAMIEAVRRIALRHADRHGGGGPDPTKITTSAHPRLHTVSDPLDHSGAITSTQHGTFATGDLHSNYVQETLIDALGDILYGSAADTAVKLAGNTTTTKKFLTQTGDGAVSAAPVWGTVVDGDVPATHSGTPHSNYVANALVDAKGDLFTATAADTPARLAVGANDTMLMADSGEATGLKWAASAQPTGDIDIGDSAATGTADTWARSDHAHGFTAPGAGYPLDVAATESDGTATTPARSDHVHKMGILTTKGDLLSYSTVPVRFGVGTEECLLAADSTKASGLDWRPPATPAWLDGVQANAAGVSPYWARCDHAHRIQHSIADNALVTVDHAAVADDDYAKFTTLGLEGRSYAEVKADLDLEDADITTLAKTVKLDDLTAPDDNTDLDASTTKHGLLPKLPNDATKFLDGTGAWDTIAIGDLPANGKIRNITFIIDGGGSAIATGIKGDLVVDFACTINAVTLLADQNTGATAFVCDIWKDTYANFPPTDADSITAAAVPTIAIGAAKGQTGVAGWTTAISAGDILRFNVDTTSTVTRVTISLKVTET